MSNRILSDLIGTLKSTFKINKATISTSGLTAARTITVPDSSITIAAAGANSDITAITGITGAIVLNSKFQIAYNAGTNSLDITYIGV